MRTLLLATGAACLSLAATACTGDTEEEKRFTSGRYVISEVDASDGCQFFDDFSFEDGVETQILVTTTSVKIGSMLDPLEYDGVATFGGTFVEEIDFRDDAVPYDCLEEDTYGFDGTVIGTDKASLDVTIEWIAVLGTGCDLANAPVTLPCTSTGTFRLTRLPPG